MIEPEDKPRKKALFTTPVEPSVVEMLRVYCEFLNSSQHHGVAQFLRCAFGRDKEFHAWVNQHPTLRNAITAFIPDEDRLVFIEDTAEIQVDKPNIVGFEARREQPDLPAVTIRDLVRGALRHRPDRIILGEVRSGEAFDLLQTLNRLATCMLEGGVELPYAALRSAIADSIQLVMQIARRDGRPTVNELLHRRSGGVIQRIVEAEEIASDRDAPMAGSQERRRLRSLRRHERSEGRGARPNESGHRRHPPPLSTLTAMPKRRSRASKRATTRPSPTASSTRLRASFRLCGRLTVSRSTVPSLSSDGSRESSAPT